MQMGQTTTNIRAVPTIIGFPKETAPLEKRLCASPDSVAKLKSRGLTVHIEKGAGLNAGFSDAHFAQAGAELVDNAFDCDAVFKIRPPSDSEIQKLKSGCLLVSMVQPDRHVGLVEKLAEKKVTLLALEKIPRVTRAQKMDVLSSMANLSGYRAVIEGLNYFQGFFGPQVTAAGSMPPAKILIIGAGVAGLAALGAARAMGADVRAFDTREAAREQVESLGGKFLTISIQESGDGGGGYAKVMSPEFIAAEIALFKAQAKEVDIIISTALVPGNKAPILLPKDLVEVMKPGSVIVDMAAEQGGNCELCKPNEIVEFQGVKILGFTDLASRMAATSSKFLAMNMVHLTGELGKGEELEINLENDVIRPALLLEKGEKLPPYVPKVVVSSAKQNPPPAAAKPAQKDLTSPTRRAWGSTVGGIFVIGLLFLLGRFAPSEFLQHSTVFVLACFVGWQVVWSVSPALHTPLMSVTNAISGIIIIGGMLQIGADFNPASILGALAVLFASINIAGGFLVTQRMLAMFSAGRSNAPSVKKGGHS
jgi:H+-translocating NAD(P) transhydrogenase subunit alpha